MPLRRGTANASEDPSLAFHWALTACCTTVSVILAIYSQIKLIALKEKSHALQMQDHPHVISALLLFAFVWPIPAMIEGGAGVRFPCYIYVVIVQIAASGIVALIAYRTLRFTVRVSQIQCSKLYFTKSGEENTTEKLENAVFVRKIAKMLSGSRPRNISIGYFVFGLFLTITDKNTRLQLIGQSDRCTMRASSFVMGSWLLFVGPYLFFLRGFAVLDPFFVFYKLKVLTAVSFVISILFSSGFMIERLISTSHFTLLGQKYAWILQITIWYLYSYLPLKLTMDKIELAAKGIGGPTLLDTLVNPSLLWRFESHLMEEWSHENILFFKDAVLQQIEAKNCYDRAKAAFNPKKKPTLDLSSTRVNPTSITSEMGFSSEEKIKRELESLRVLSAKIYYKYIHPDCISEINIPYKAKNVIIEFFSSQDYYQYQDMFDLQTQNSTALNSIRSITEQKSGTLYTINMGRKQRLQPKNQMMDKLSQSGPKSFSNSFDLSSDAKDATSLPLGEFSRSPVGLRRATRAHTLDGASDREQCSIAPDRSTRVPLDAVSFDLGTRGGSPSKSARNVIRAHKKRQKDIEAFCAALASAIPTAMERKVNNDCKNELGISQVDIFAKHREKRAMISKETKSSLEDIEVLKRMQENSDIFNEIVQLHDVFDAAKQLVFSLMENDSHRRFKLKLTKEQQKAIHYV
ncbi:hypothetical protein AAMO2058_001136200 [Amorphochlora amoebiformis]